MLMIERQNQMMELLRQRGAAELDELAEAVGVSLSTVRRDLDALQDRGLVRRTHGGAVLTSTEMAAPLPSSLNPEVASGPSVALATRMEEHTGAKAAIARVAAALVQPQMTVMMDGGSTVVFAARAITARPIQVVTNSLSIAQLYKDDELVEVVSVGGTLYPRTEVTTGSIATGTLAELHADLAFTSLAGLDAEAAYNINLSMARVEQVMIQQATRSVLLMDSTKFGRKSLVRVAGLDEFDAVITDDSVDPSWRDRLGDRLVVAPASPPQAQAG